MVFQTIEFDPMCDKERPQKITFEDVSAAAFRIQSGIVKTPCVVRNCLFFTSRSLKLALTVFMVPKSKVQTLIISVFPSVLFQNSLCRTKILQGFYLVLYVTK